jgi:poly-gamma-glutamate capsule biosynthesis protein CapA/YwtB (metallophosphatase superfamily)
MYKIGVNKLKNTSLKLAFVVTIAESIAMNGVARLVSIGAVACVLLFALRGPLEYVAAPLPVFVAPSARVIVGGDMMFDRSIRTTINAKGGDYVFSCIDPALSGADLVVANLEGPITSNPSKSVGSAVGGEGNYTFTFPVATAGLLYRHGVRVVNLGNNHILNFDFDGLRSTESELKKSGVQYFGDPVEQDIATTSIHGIELAFINYNQFGLGSYEARASTTISQIRNAKSADEIAVVYTHWGTEYQPADEYQIALAHEFIDAGAAIVIGSHPHVVQAHEIYKGKNIYYSLGNFIFDQYWMDSVRSGLLLNIMFDQSGVKSVQEIPVRLSQDRCTRAAL